jgi:membrane-bound lytic murein transglycosylase B
MKNKISKKNLKILTFFLLLFFGLQNYSFSTNHVAEFDKWLVNFKKTAVEKGVSNETVNMAFKNVKFLDQVIKYDRKQPEFFEDTITYITKRATPSRVKNALKLLKKNESLFNEIENKYNVEKEVLLSLWAVETNFGKHVGKMDIISCLATLSFDKRRSEFFSKQLLTLLTLIDKKIIYPDELFGSWAGAYGNFQFMPSTISNYAIDYDNNGKIELKSSLPDALASAANYINKIGWKKGEPCFIQVKLTKKIHESNLNKSARNIKNKKKITSWNKKGVKNINGRNLEANYKSALISPDGYDKGPKYLIFNNYEKILQWNRSLRFGITVCTLAEKIKS